jgi:hypothetical protein
LNISECFHLNGTEDLIGNEVADPIFDQMWNYHYLPANEFG